MNQTLRQQVAILKKTIADQTKTIAEQEITIAQQRSENMVLKSRLSAKRIIAARKGRVHGG